MITAMTITTAATDTTTTATAEATATTGGLTPSPRPRSTPPPTITTAAHSASLSQVDLNIFGLSYYCWFKARFNLIFLRQADEADSQLHQTQPKSPAAVPRALV